MLADDIAAEIWSKTQLFLNILYLKETNERLGGKMGWDIRSYNDSHK